MRPNTELSAEPKTPRRVRSTCHLLIRSINRWVLPAILLWVSGAGPGEAGINGWTSNGPEGGTISSLAIAGASLRAPTSPDFNGDGTADLLWRHTSGAVAIWLMNGPTPVSVASAGSVPADWTIVGFWDFNGDGKTDIL